MSIARRKPRHQSQRFQGLPTADAILVVAEEICAESGASNLKLADIASALGIEPPSLYRHYDGLKGVIAALAEVAIKAEIETFAGLDALPFHQAFKLQAERLFDLYIERPGLARLLMVDLAVPGGLQGYDSDESVALVRRLFALEADLLARGVKAQAIRPLSLTSFIAARMGPALTAIALKDLRTPGSSVELDGLKKEYLATVSSILRAPRPSAKGAH